MQKHETYIYIHSKDFSFPVVAWTHVAEAGVNVALRHSNPAVRAIQSDGAEETVPPPSYTVSSRRRLLILGLSAPPLAVWASWLLLQRSWTVGTERASEGCGSEERRSLILPHAWLRFLGQAHYRLACSANLYDAEHWWSRSMATRLPADFKDICAHGRSN